MENMLKAATNTSEYFQKIAESKKIIDALYIDNAKIYEGRRKLKAALQEKLDEKSSSVKNYGEYVKKFDEGLITFEIRKFKIIVLFFFSFD
jgi:hypothetical protein